MREKGRFQVDEAAVKKPAITGYKSNLNELYPEDMDRNRENGD